MQKRCLLVGLPIVALCLAGVFFFFVFPIIAHLKIVGAARNYQPEVLLSFDDKFLLQVLKYEDDSGAYASFVIESYATGEEVFLCPEKYRTMDLKSISWDDETYTVIVVSSDVGTMYYCFVGNTWVKNSEKSINWSVSKYSEITSRHYEESPNGYKAAFYEKNEIEITRINDWLASCESFVENDEPPNTVAGYLLIRIQAPLRGAWPDSYKWQHDQNVMLNPCKKLL